MTRRISVEIVGNSASLERSFRRSSSAAQGFERDVSRTGRGIAAVSLGFAGLGRSLAFASSAFIGAAGLTEAVKSAVEGAENLRKAQDSVRVALEHTGEAVGKVLPQYDAVAKAAASLGVSQVDSLTGLAKATTLTGNAASAFRAYTEALNISKATHVSFDAALTATSKGQEGITTSLQRYGIEIKKGTSGTDQFRIVMARFGDQAKANTSNLDRLRANAANLGNQLGGPLLGVLDRVAARLSTAIGNVSRFASRVGAQTTIIGKLNVIWTGVTGATAGAVSALAGAVRGIDWAKVWEGARGIADGLQKRLEAINWGTVGTSIGNGIAEAVKKAIPAAKDIGNRLTEAVSSINVVELGKKLGPGLAAAVATAFATLTDPSFWLHNWQLALSVGLVAFGDGIGRIAGRLAEPLVRVFGRLGGDAALAIAGVFEKSAPRLGEAVLGALLRLPGIAARALRPLTSVVERVFGRLGNVARFVVKVIGIDAAIRIVEHAVGRLAHLIGSGLDAAWRALERRALQAALNIVEPFSHLPGFLGGGPFQDMKAALEQKLADMDKAAKRTARSVQDSMAGAAAGARAAFESIDQASSAAQIAASRAQQAADRAGVPTATQRPRRTPHASAEPTGAGVPGGPGGAPAATTAVQQGFVLPFRLQLAQAKAAATATLADDLRVAREIKDFILKQIPHLHGQKLIDAYNQLGQINQEIASDVQQAAHKAKQSVTFTAPARLQLALARDAALGLDQTKDLLKLRASILKFIRTHKNNIKALIDAYNQLASVNQQLGQTAQTALGLFKQASTRALTAGLGLTAAQRKALQARLSQLGPGGTVPGQGTGAFGFVIGDNGRAIQVDGSVNMDGKKVGKIVSRHQHRRRQRNPTQRRGPNAATSTA